MRKEIEDKMKDTADYIFRHPELSLYETESSAKLAEFLESEGFAVRWDLAGFETAFVAEWGSPVWGRSRSAPAPRQAVRGMAADIICWEQPARERPVC